MTNHADKPPIEELRQFLEFQLPRQWAPVYGDLPLAPRHKRQVSPSLQFTFMGPRLYVNTSKVNSLHAPSKNCHVMYSNLANAWWRDVVVVYVVQG